MKLVPRSNHPAVALAAAMLNHELGVAKYDVAASAESGDLSVHPRPGSPLVTAVSYKEFTGTCTVTPNQGVIYITPFETAAVEALMQEVASILSEYEDHLQHPHAVAGRYHERLWVKPRDRSGTGLVTEESDNSGQFLRTIYTSLRHGKDWFKWKVCPLGHPADIGETWNAPVNQVFCVDSALVIDMVGILDSARPDSPSWIPTYEELGIPPIENVGSVCLSPTPLHAEALAGHMYIMSQTQPWSNKMPAISEIVDSDTEEDMLKTIGSFQECPVCNCDMIGPVGIVVDQEKSCYIPACYVCTGIVAGFQNSKKVRVRKKTLGAEAYRLSKEVYPPAGAWFTVDEGAFDADSPTHWNATDDRGQKICLFNPSHRDFPGTPQISSPLIRRLAPDYSAFISASSVNLFTVK